MGERESGCYRHQSRAREQADPSIVISHWLLVIGHNPSLLVIGH